MARDVAKQTESGARATGSKEHAATERAPSVAAGAGTPAYLQRAALDGSQDTVRSAAAEQSGPVVGERSDPLEREAEQVAAGVLGGSGAQPAAPVRADSAGVMRRSPKGAAGSGSSPALNEALGSRGAGAPLPAPVRRAVEPAVGRDLSDVRVHDDGAAHAAADSIDAKAFTSGSDVWLGAGQSAQDVGLMAHEATHVAQQSPGVVRRTAKQDAAAGKGTSEPAAPAEGATVFRPKKKTLGWIEVGADGAAGTLHLAKLKVPFVGERPKVAQDHPDAAAAPAQKKAPILSGKPWMYTGTGVRGSKSARLSWLESARKLAAPGIKAKLAQKVRDAGGASTVDEKAPEKEIVGLVLDKSQMQFQILGSVDELCGLAGSDDENAGQHLLIPVWSAQGKKTYFDVDHAHEIQLGGLDAWENFWLWESAANRSSGMNIFEGMKAQVDALTEAAIAEGFWSPRGTGKKKKKKAKKKGDVEPEAVPPAAPSFEEVRTGWTLRVDALAPLPIAGQPQTFWSRKQIAEGKHLDRLRVLNAKELAALGVGKKTGTPKVLRIFTTPTGGSYKELPWSFRASKDGESKLVVPHLYGGFDLTSVTYDISKQGTPGARVGTLRGVPFRIKKRNIFSGERNISIAILAAPALGFGGYLDQKVLREEFREIDIPGSSPVAVDFVGIGPEGNLSLEGRILATKALFPGLEIPISVVGTDVRIDFPVPTEKLSLGPVRVTQAFLRIVYGEKGIAFEGVIGFAVDGLGRGLLEAKGRDFEGVFDLEFDALDPARIEVKYIDDVWSAQATLGLREGALPGVESAKVEVGIGPEGPRVGGSLLLGVGPFKGIELLAAWNREQGFSIGAENFALPVANVPGVESATASVHVRRTPAGAWGVSGGGTATFGLKGVGGTLTISLDGDRITISGAGKVERGFVTGQVAFLVSNLPRDEQGQPTEGEPTDELVASGSGSATIAFGKVLQGTVGMTVEPSGEVVLRGEIALPPRLPVFAPWQMNKDLFRPPPLDIPILGVSAFGKRIGIFATLSGGLSAHAAIGPGVLEDTSVAIEFNPDRQEDTKITGTSSFVVDASAGLRLFVRGGLGAGIPVVSATAGIELGAQLGIAAQARASVALEWTPQKGLVLDAVAKVEAAPRFTFDVSAFLDVDLDLWLKTINLVSKRWKLASFEFGPGLRFGVEAPIRWSEQGGLELSAEAIRIQRPELDLKRTAIDLVKELVG